MNTIALRFADNFAPEPGTISLHNEVIKNKGYVWYGKLGSKVSNSIMQEILHNSNPRILLIHSGKAKRYWAYIDDVSYTKPDMSEYPSYYCDKADDMKTWFRVIRIVEASSSVMSECYVLSSGAPLSESSKYSMSPYFKIQFRGGIVS